MQRVKMERTYAKNARRNVGHDAVGFIVHSRPEKSEENK